MIDTVFDWLGGNRRILVGIVVVLLVMLLLQRTWHRVRRRRKPAPLHPRLQAYAGRTESDLEAQRTLAAGIVATSSTPTAAGYDLIRQIEAVFVEGHRTPDDAVTALKALAVRKGANAIINLSQSRTAAGRCTAQGDAVLVRPTGEKAARGS